jgi:hypothetical protein
VPVEDSFDVVSVRVNDECCVIPGVVMRAKARRAVVAAAGFDSGAVEPVDDRAGNRIHVTDKQGNFKQEIKMAETTGVGGSTGGVMFSNDPGQRFPYISDLTNNKVWFLDRKTGEVKGTLGQMGENAGSFFGLHMEATDSKGNLYTGEVFYGERVQRFLLRQ